MARHFIVDPNLLGGSTPTSGIPPSWSQTLLGSSLDGAGLDLLRWRDVSVRSEGSNNSLYHALLNSPRFLTMESTLLK